MFVGQYFPIYLVAVQIIIFNNMNFLGFIIPLPHTVYNTIPRQWKQMPFLFASFLLGLTMDYSNSEDTRQLVWFWRMFDQQSLSFLLLVMNTKQ
jgi:hypothetical protein